MNTRIAIEEVNQITAETPAPCETFFIAWRDPLPCYGVIAWNAVPEGGDAIQMLEDAQTKNPALTVVAVTGDEFNRLMELAISRRAHNSLRATDEDTFQQALNILPPMKWETFNGVEVFMLPEAYSGSWHPQHGRFNDLYASKLVDRRDRATWLTEADIKAVNNTTAAKYT